MQDSHLIDKKTLAALLNVSVRTVSGLMASGHIPFIRIGTKLVRFSPVHVQHALGIRIADGAPTARAECPQQGA